MAKIVFIGAGSIIFVKNLIGDCLLTPCLQDSEYALLDINREKLCLAEKMLKNLNRNINQGRAVIKAYEDQKEALKDADFVLNAICVGDYDPCLVKDFEIPMKYGLKQTFADTLGIGGMMRALRTVPVVQGIIRDMEEVCPKAYFLNYVNPMAIITGAIQRTSRIKTIGLCHSVQVCTKELLEGLGMSNEGVEYKIAGINHQAWLLEVTKEGKDLYPEIKEKAFKRTDKHEDLVRYEIMKRFGYYVTESTQHSGEYLPYFLKKSYPELEEVFGLKTVMYKDWGQSRIDYWKQAKEELVDDPALTHERTREFASYIMESLLTGKLTRIHANVLNCGYITNLPEGSCVEVPCLVDGTGIHPCFVGELPMQCAALNQTNINFQTLAARASLSHRKEDLYQAMMLDPHTSAELSLEDIVSMCDELLEINKDWLPEFA